MPRSLAASAARLASTRPSRASRHRLASAAAASAASATSKPAAGPPPPSPAIAVAVAATGTAVAPAAAAACVASNSCCSWCCAHCCRSSRRASAFLRSAAGPTSSGVGPAGQRHTSTRLHLRTDTDGPSVEVHACITTSTIKCTSVTSSQKSREEEEVRPGNNVLHAPPCSSHQHTCCAPRKS